MATSVSSPLFVRYLSGNYALLMRFMRSLHLPRRPSSPPRQLSTPDKHFLHFFCPFGVRSRYPVICDSTFSVTACHISLTKGNIRLNYYTYIITVCKKSLNHLLRAYTIQRVRFLVSQTSGLINHCTTRLLVSLYNTTCIIFCEHRKKTRINTVIPIIHLPTKADLLKTQLAKFYMCIFPIQRGRK